MALDIHAQNVSGVCAYFGFIIGQLDTACFASAANLYLCFNNNGIASFVGNSNRFINSGGNPTC